MESIILFVFTKFDLPLNLYFLAFVAKNSFFFIGKVSWNRESDRNDMKWKIFVEKNTCFNTWTTITRKYEKYIESRMKLPLNRESVVEVIEIKFKNCFRWTHTHRIDVFTLLQESRKLILKINRLWNYKVRGMQRIIQTLTEYWIAHYVNMKWLLIGVVLLFFHQTEMVDSCHCSYEHT